ncbi:hypothetical protein [Maricaulis sp.]|uniref:hypothetical protein n=1 Tax=Maricaulis sp. TaxID=1486257 RepID=UPI003A8CC2E4
MSVDPFESAELLIGRAKENRAEFEARCTERFKSVKAAPFEEPDPQTGGKFLKLRFPDLLPRSIHPVFSDGINNVRHSLDQATNAAVVTIRGGKPNCYFPFAKDVKDFEAIFESRRYKTIPVTLRPFLAHMKPYLGGDDLLWSLGRLSGPNKHQTILVSTPEATHNVGSWGVGRDFTPLHAWDGAKQELTLGHIAPGGQIQLNYNFLFQVSLGDAPIVGGQKAVAVLDAFISKAESVVSGLKAETMRLTL